MQILSIKQLRAELTEYKNPDTKIGRMRKNGDIFRVHRGIYVKDRNIIKESLSGLICGPSYVSFEDALAEYNLIPEQVFECSCATFGKQRNILYKNDLGYYSFTNIPRKAYPYGVCLYRLGQYSWNMATPEKAICDLLYTRKPLKDKNDVVDFLLDGMRIDENDFSNLNKKEMVFLAALYDHHNLRLLKEALLCM